MKRLPIGLIAAALLSGCGSTPTQPHVPLTAGLEALSQSLAYWKDKDAGMIPEEATVTFVITRNTGVEQKDDPLAITSPIIRRFPWKLVANEQTANTLTIKLKNPDFEKNKLGRVNT